MTLVHMLELQLVLELSADQEDEKLMLKNGQGVWGHNQIEKDAE